MITNETDKISCSPMDIYYDICRRVNLIWVGYFTSEAQVLKRATVTDKIKLAEAFKTIMSLSEGIIGKIPGEISPC